MATRVKLLHTAISPTLAGANFTGDVNFEGGQLQYDASSNSLDFQDNIFAQFGTGNDLRIYHDSSNSYIKNTIGWLNMPLTQNGLSIANSDFSEPIARFLVNGACELYYDGSKKFETSSAGATVAGTLTVTGDLDITGNVNSTSVTDLDVTDKTITLGVGQTEAQSGGSGIVIDGSSASMLWDESTDLFDFNKGISTTGNVGIGSSNPDKPLVVQGTGAEIAISDTDNTPLLRFRESGTTKGTIQTATGAMIFQINGTTELMRLRSDSKVGIGATSSPYGRLTVTQASGADNDEGGIGIVDSSNGRSMRLYCSATTSFINSGNGGGQNLVLNEGAGNVGIGDSNPSEKLVVKGDGARIIVSSADMEVAMIGRRGSSGAALDDGYLRLRNQGVTADGVVINTNGDSWLNGGDVGIGTASPSYKFDVYGTDDITMRIHRPSSGLAATDTCGIGFSQRGDANTSTSDTRAAIVSSYNGSLHLCTEPGGNLNSNPVDHSALSIIGTNQYVGIGTSSPTNKLTITDGATPYSTNNHLVQVKRDASNGNDDTSKASILLGNNSNGFSIAYGGTTDRLRFIDGGNNETVSILNGGQVGIGTETVTSGVKLEVNGGRIYVPNSTVQASSALIGAHTNYKWREQATGGNGQYAGPSANKTAAYIGSNSSSRGIVIQRDSIGNTFPDFAITESGYTYMGNNITMQNGGNDSADYRAGAPGYVNWGSKIECHEWKNWSGTGNYTARLYTPIVHNESNMFQIEIDVYGYSSGGRAQRYVGGGYAYSGSSLISHGTVAISGSLTHRLTTATHPNYSSTVIVFDIGYSNNNGTNYYNHMRWRYQGWNGKRAEDFVWGAVTT